MDFALFLMIYISTVCLSKSQSQSDKVLIDRMKVHNVSKSDIISIDMVLSSESSIHAFMIHLSKEYSMELLLSYIEITQFQQYIAEQMEPSQLKGAGIHLIVFPSNIPQSEIIECKEEFTIQAESEMDRDDIFINNAKIKSHKLYNKYIKSGSEFEVNIPSEERYKLSNMLDKLDLLLSYNMNLVDLLLLFEECKQEMKVLQTFSLSRFKNHTEFIGDV